MRNRSSRLKIIKRGRAALDRRRAGRAQADPCPECGRALFTAGVPDVLLMSRTPGSALEYCAMCEATAKRHNPAVQVISLQTPSRGDLRDRIAEEFGG